jgi:hypothetical protein
VPDVKTNVLCLFAGITVIEQPAPPILTALGVTISLLATTWSLMKTGDPTENTGFSGIPAAWTVQNDGLDHENCPVLPCGTCHWPKFEA